VTAEAEVLRGDKVTLRPAVPDDAPAIDAVLATPEVQRWWGSSEGALRRIVDDEVQVLAVEVDGAVIGFVQFAEETDPMYRSAGVDIALHPGHHGHGYGTDTMQTLVRHLVEGRGHHRITIDPAAANAAAIACYRKAGFTEVGIMRRYERGPDGTWHDGLLMEHVVD
jgi:aminoglycoside 6'-N-acetyltransferase